MNTETKMMIVFSSETLSNIRDCIYEIVVDNLGESVAERQDLLTRMARMDTFWNREKSRTETSNKTFVPVLPEVLECFESLCPAGVRDDDGNWLENETRSSFYRDYQFTIVASNLPPWTTFSSTRTVRRYNKTTEVYEDTEVTRLPNEIVVNLPSTAGPRSSLARTGIFNAVRECETWFREAFGFDDKKCKVFYKTDERTQLIGNRLTMRFTDVSPELISLCFFLLANRPVYVPTNVVNQDGKHSEELISTRAEYGTKAPPQTGGRGRFRR